MFIMDLDEQKLSTPSDDAMKRFLRHVNIVKQDPRSKIVRKFSNYTDVAGPQIDSFNQFLRKAKDEVINTTKILLQNNHTISFSDAEFANPSMLTIDQSKRPTFPSYCRHNDRTYKGSTNATASWFDENGELRGRTTIHLHDMPIMLRSQACNLANLTNQQLRDVLEDKDDPFGYFVVDGAEKVIVMQERVAPNVLLSYQDPRDKVTANNPLASTITTEVKCVAPDGRKVKVAVRLMKKAEDDLGEAKRSNATAPVLKVILPSFVESGAEINVCAIFGVLGLLTDDPTFFQNPDNIQAYVLDWVADEDKELVAKYLDYSLEAYTLYRDNPLGYIAEKLRLTERELTPEQMRTEVIRQVRDSMFVNMNENLDATRRPYEKHIEMLAYLVARHISVVTGLRGRRINPAEANGLRDVTELIRLGLDDRDDEANKIVDTAGTLFMFLYSQAYNEMMSRAASDLNERLNQPDLLAELSAILRRTIVTDTMTRAVRSGDWGMPNKVKHKGLTRTLQRASIVGAIADVRSVNAPIPRESKDVRPRSVHISTYGFICPTSTKEGEDCLSLDTEITLADGTTTQLALISETKQEIVTVHDQTLVCENSTAKNYFQYEASSKQKQVYELTTITGRSIRATGEHPFLTADGWKRVDQLDVKNDKLTVQHFYAPLPPSVATAPYVILTKELFGEILASSGVQLQLIANYQSELPFPFSSNYQHLHVLARMFGILITDGSLTISGGKISCGIKFGQMIDGESFVKDLQLLGFSSVKVVPVQTEQEIDGRLVVHNCFSVQKGGAFPALLLALGAPYGRRSEKATPVIPEWVLRGEPLVRREFLAGVMGGDGCQIGFAKRPNKPRAYNFEMSPFGQHKTEEHVPSLVSWMEQFKEMLLVFGVETHGIESKLDYKDKVKVSLRFSRSEANLVRYMKQIGYRYASTKQNQGFLVCEYLLYKELKVQERVEFKRRVFELLATGMRAYAVARELGVKPGVVTAIVQTGVDAVTLAPKDTLTMGEFITLVKTNSDDHLYLPITSIVKRKSEMVGDFTTHNSNHSFVANGYVVHNCGLAKSLTQGATITTSSDPRLVRDILLPNRNYVEDPEDDTNRKRFITYQRDMLHDTPVFINGGFVGYGGRDDVHFEIVMSRREHAVDRQVSVRLDLDGILQIHTEAGWLVRPLLVVDVDQQLIVDKEGLWDADWGTLLERGAAEYVTASEQADLLIAPHPNDLGKAVIGLDPNTPASYQEARDATLSHIPQYTHVELDPALLFSEEANTVPFPQHNPGTRPTYASNMAKHLVGVWHSSHRGIPATRAIPATATTDAVPAQPAIPGRFESSKVLAYPQKPIVRTDTYRRGEPELTNPRILEELGKTALQKTDEEVEDIRSRLAEALNDDMFGIVGNMATVAILGAIPEAFDEEDAIMLNRGFVDRGGFMSTTYKADEYEIENPDSEKLMTEEQLANIREEDKEKYSAIDPATGIARVGSVLRPGMAIVAKYVEENGREPRNTSIFLKSADTLTPARPLKVAAFSKTGQKIKDQVTGELRYETRDEYNERVARVRSVLSTSISNEPIMDDVLVGRSGAGKTFIKWKYRITRRPQVGDKFTSRFSQKGVVGQIFSPEDMPFSAITGIAPDIAVNKHGYITRMTLGQVLESITGKAAVMFGTYVNATAFRDVDHEVLKSILTEHGFHYSGGEPYISGTTGEMLEAMVFTGPVYYQIQKHMVEEKRHGRALGDVHHLYRQPPEGRQRDGGLRLGEMERDCLISHQARGWLIERYMTVSDESTVYICKKCELPCLANPQRPLFMCEVCGSTDPVPPTKVPRSLLLLYGYNAAMGTKISMKTGPVREVRPQITDGSEATGSD